MLLHLDNETVRLLSVLSMLVAGVMYLLAWRADPGEDTPKFWAIGFGVGVLVYPVVELGGGAAAAAYVIGAIYATAGALFVYGAARYARWHVRPRLVISAFLGFWGVLALLRIANAPRSWPMAVIDVGTAVVLLILAAAFHQRWRDDRHNGHLGLAAIFAVWGGIRFLPLVHSGGGELVLTSVALLGRLSTAALFMFLVQQRIVARLRREAKERELAEATAREQGRRFADLVELSCDWAWETDADLRITYMSPKIRDLTGMPPEFYVGKTRDEADASRERGGSWRVIEDAMLARQPFRDVPMQSPRRDTGRLLHYELSGKPVFDAQGGFAGYRGVGRDVSDVMRQMQERERAEVAARESEHRFESLVALSSDWIWELDESLRFTYVSPQIYDFSGMPPEFYVGKTRADTYATTDVASGWATLEAKMQARESFRDLPMRSFHRQTGKAVYYLLSGAPIYDMDGRFCGFRGIGRDVTAQTVSRSTVDAILGGLANSVGTDYFEALVGHLARALEMDVVAVATGTGRDLELKTQAIWMDGRLVDRRQFATTGSPVEAMMAGESCEYPAGVARVFPSDRWLCEQKIEGLIGTPLRDNNTGRPIGVLLLEKRSPMHNCDITRTVLSALAPRAAAELQRQIADEQVREAEQRFRTVVDNMSSGLVVKAGHRYTAANQTIADWTGIPVEEIVGMTDVELFLRMGWGEERQKAANAVQRQSIETGEPRLWESTARFGDGRVRDTILTSFPIPSATAEPAAIGMLITDVTDLRRAETNLQQTQKMEALGRLAGGVAHDFNNIVGAIQGFARFIVEESPSGSQTREDAERIVSASMRAKELIQQVLTFSRRTEIHRERVSVPAAIADAVALLKPMARAPVRIEIGQSLPGAVIDADPGQIGQVLVNLGVNALDAIDGAAGRIVFSLRRQRGAAGIGTFEARARAVAPSNDIRVADGTVDPAQNYVVIRVEDTGGGMTREVAERVFEPFFTTKPPGKGTGLGLAVVHGIVLNHRGAIAITARPGHGTTFDIWLPEAEAGPAEGRSDAGSKVGPDVGPRRQAEPRRVLIVDDAADFGDMLATAIERLGYEVAVATNAHDAIATIDEDAAAWDLIITDKNMPGLSGLDVIARVKSRRSDLPCILCTADAGSVTADVIRRSGASAFLRKPIDAASLESILKRLLHGEPGTGPVG